ncbi:Heme/hemopexin-binding protein precursor, partial [Haemophilus influenzae]|jgi:ribulose-5-phosphate 4-epimerase/fuculose-1-phosphate aldolase
VI